MYMYVCLLGICHHTSMNGCDNADHHIVSQAAQSQGVNHKIHDNQCYVFSTVYNLPFF